MILNTLNGRWNLSGNYSDKEINCSISIPGDIHSSLLENKIIENPFYGFNEQKSLWVGQTDWTITRDFEYKKIKNTRTIIELTQADTFFTLFINEKKVGCGQNQFARYRFDITDYLENGKNTISILLESAEKKSKEISKTLPYPVPYMKYDVYSPDRNLARKCQCNGGWDWGPCIMTSGVYGDIIIYTVTDGLFESITCSYTRKQKNNWIVTVNAEFDSFIKGTKDFVFKIEGNDIEESFSKQKIKLQKGKNHISASISVSNPQIWKTAGELKESGLTENKVYNLSVYEYDSTSGTVTENRKICFSTLKVVSKKDNANNKEGRSLYFENNGRKIFAKGSNWIPADSLPSAMTNERYADLLYSAVKANENCLRVWGGGIYEKEIFYDLCDRLGIIVWQDCMFACALYPSTEDFFKEVAAELEYQIPRLQTHASIGIWCGNNENFGSLSWFKESRENRDRYLVDYDRLYHGLIGTTIKKLDPARTYWPSSPCPGPDDFGDNWHNDNMGDMHYWSVWHERKDFSAYLSINPRFVAEFGYESFPSLDCIETFADTSQYNFTSPVMEYHQRSPSGNSIMLENFSRYFRFPVGFENMVYLSQIQQAVAIKTAVDWWRSLKPHCMGSIIWQLNDVWPGPSWSSIEYGGKWKLLQYETKKFFDIVYMPLFIKDDKLHCVICNDTLEELRVNVKLSLIKFDGQILKQIELNEILKADTTKEVFTETINAIYCTENQTTSENYFIYGSLEAVSETQKAYKCNNTVWIKAYKKCQIADTKISMEIKKAKDSYQIILSTDKPAFFVSLDAKGISGLFSDNMITLLPDEKKTILFKTKEEITLKQLKDCLSVKDLRSTF